MTVSRVLWISCLLIGSIICVPVEYGMITLTKLRKLNKIKWPWIHSGSCLVSPQIMDLIWNMTIWAHTPCRREHFFMTIPKTVQIMRQTTAMPTSPQTPVLVLVVTGVTRWLGMTGSLVAIQGGTVFTLIPAVRKTSLFLVTCLVWNQSTLLALVHATKEEEQCLPKPATPPQSLLAYLCRYSHTPATHFLDIFKLQPKLPINSWWVQLLLAFHLSGVNDNWLINLSALLYSQVCQWLFAQLPKYLINCFKLKQCHLFPPKLVFNNLSI